MASAAANHRGRSSTTGTGAPMHLGSFSRLDIADFDSRGRYPTTPSPQEIRTGLPVAPTWYPSEATPLPAPINIMKTRQDELADQANTATMSNGQLTPPDGDLANNNGESAAIPTAIAVQASRGSADSSSMPIGGPQGLQDPAARASLPPGPRHPQAPSRASTASAAGPSQSPPPQQRTGSKPPAPYPYSPATTAKPLATGSPINNPNSPSRQGELMPYGSTTLQVQNAPRAQVPSPPEEVCIECMMRDRDMADVIVTGPGVWDRESDVHIRDLLEREDEEERAWRERHAAELAITGNKLRPPRRASKGHRLTEQNLKIWLTLVCGFYTTLQLTASHTLTHTQNPKESHARLMTIDSYVRQQATLLVIEAEARAKAQQEAQRVDARLSDAYRQSVYGEDGASSSSMRMAPRSSVYSVSPTTPKDEYSHTRDMTLLDNGMVVERINVKREEKERKREEKKAGKSSIISFGNRDSIAPMTPGQGQMEFVNSGSDYEPPFGAMSSTSLQVQSQSQSRPKSAPLGVPLAYGAPSSVDGGKNGPRFMGSKHWQQGWSSGVSVAPSGSMMDMQYVLVISSFDVDSNALFQSCIGSRARPTVAAVWNADLDQPTPSNVLIQSTCITPSQRKATYC